MQYVNQLKVVGLIVISVFVVGCNSVSEDLSLHDAIELSRDSIKALAMTEEAGLSASELQTLRSASDKKLEQAVAAYEKLIDKSPEKAVYYNNLAWLLIKHGDVDKAKVNLKSARRYVKDGRLLSIVSKNLEAVTALGIEIKEAEVTLIK